MLKRATLLAALIFAALLSARGATAQTAPSPVTVTAGPQGFRLGSADGDFLLRLRGDVQADGRFFPDDEGVFAGGEGAASNFYVRRVRLKVQGRLWGRYAFKVMPNFGFGRARLQDAYLGVRFAPGLRLRAGKFKQPVGLEYLRSPANLFFLERGYPSALAPHRDVGFMLHGRLAGERLRYAVGLFNGAADGGGLNIDTGSGKDAAARLFATPFAEGPLSGLGLGVAGSYGEASGGSGDELPGFRTPGRQDFFAYRDAAVADGTRWRLAPQGYFFGGPVGLLAEYTVSQQEVRMEGEPEEAETLARNAWQIAGGVMLTGEAQSSGSLRPDAPYGGLGEGASGGFGALELVARVHGLSLDEDTFPRFADPTAGAQSVTTWGAGLNWYLSQNVRLSATYERSRFDAASEAPGEANFATEHFILTRFQIVF